MTIHRLTSRALEPDTKGFADLFAASSTDTASIDFSAIQPRLHYGLTQLGSHSPSSSFMLVKAPETPKYLSLLASIVPKTCAPAPATDSYRYNIDGHHITLVPAHSGDNEFAARGDVVFADWIEHESLFGSVRFFANSLTLHPGLIHRANGGGVMILSLRTVLTQPLLWLRLKKMVTQHHFNWLPADETDPLPVIVPSLPLDLKVILVGSRDSLADFQEMEPELTEQAIYSEYEEEMSISDESDMQRWIHWVNGVSLSAHLPTPAADCWPALIHEAVRYTGDQQILPLCPEWLKRQLKDVSAYCEGAVFNAAQLQEMFAARAWREGFLAKRIQDEILFDQILIETEGERIGQINALSVVEFPGHPRAFGEPSRISCVVHIGDGEFTDVDRKAELGGNIHSKGMLIMQAFLMSELQLDQPLPFSASLTFEQSYSEVDGDSASMAELCVLISALADIPVNQQIAITGSVDQFGRAQPVGGLNEKIEGFFAVCEARGLSRQQGVIIPSANKRHLCLNNNVQAAVNEERFFIWAVDGIKDILPLLTHLPWKGEGEVTLLQTIQERIAQATQQEMSQRIWPLRWLNWFNHN